MPDSAPWTVQTADLTWQEDLPGDPASGDIFFSREDGPAETECVFLHGNRLSERWAQLPPERPGVFVVAETGFGSGLNFLLTWDLFLRTAPPSWQLHYISVEHRPWQREDLARAHAHWPTLQACSQALLAAWPLPLRGPHRLHLAGDRVRLTLLFDEALPALQGLQGEVHAWFLDGFAPARNQSIWRTAVLQEIARLSIPGTTLATYTAAGAVRNGLQGVGFHIERKTGFAGKRHRVEGIMPGAARARPGPRPTRAVIVGAGFAGVCVAGALARRGLAVQLLDAAESPASGASGVPQAVQYLKLSGACSDVARLQLQALLYASTDTGAVVLPTSTLRGILQLGDATQVQRWHSLSTLPPALLQRVDVDQASALAGMPLERGGLWFPGAFTVPGVDFCEAQLARWQIPLQGGRTVTRVTHTGDAWRLDLGGDSAAIEADVLIACTGVGMPAGASLTGLPVRSIRGQLSHLHDQNGALPRCTITGAGHVIPVTDHAFFAGSSYAHDEVSLHRSSEDDQHNRNRAAELLGRERGKLEILGAWAGLRAAGPDHLPAAGALPGEAQRYTLCGLRSRGLLYSPLLAESIASELCGEPVPLTRSQWQMLRPARWLPDRRPRNPPRQK